MILNARRTRGCATSQATLLAVALLTFMGAGALWSISGKAPKHKTSVVMAQTQPSAPTEGDVKVRAFASAGRLPLSFEPNRGQADAQTVYSAHGSGFGLSLIASEAVLSLRGVSKDGNPISAAVHLQLEGAAANPKIAATDILPGKSNYLYGNDPKRWVRNVPQFARVQYSAVYPGIDLVYYGKQGQLEYDFVVRSGADPRQIRLNVAGAEQVSLGTDGSLCLKTPVRELRWNKPVVYQEVNGQRRKVAGRFDLLARNRIGFALGEYDRSRELIIDPILAYATYFGGAGNEINPQVVVDVNSNIYLAGTTSSAAGFPIPSGGTQPPLKGATDVFVSKLNSIGSLVVYTTYINGTTLATGTDSSAGLAVDNAGDAYVTGTTTSSDFPVTAATAFQTAPKAAGTHVFLTKLDPTGANLLYSSYLSGSNTDNAFALAADNSGNAYVLGSTQSVADFPIAGAVFQPGANNATQLFFVSKFNTAATSSTASLAFSSFLGGGTPTVSATPANGVICAQLPCGGIALDTTGNAYVAVGTTFTNLAVTNAFQASNHGGADAFVAKIKVDGTALLYSTYIGGALDDAANAIALDSSGNAYITGSTKSTDLPAGSTAGFQSANGGGTTDAFVAKLNNPTSGTVVLTYASYLGGSGADTGFAIVADSSQNAYVTGSTSSSNFPSVPAGGQAANATDAFLVKVATTTGSTAGLSSSALLGGSGIDRGTSIAQNINGGVLVTGDTNSTNFPVGSTISGVTPLQLQLNGTGSGPNSDAFLANFGPVTDLKLVVAPPPIVSPATVSRVGIGNVATFTYTVTNLGPDASTGAVLTIPVPPTSSGVTAAAFTSSSGSCALTGTTETCTLGTLAANGTPATITAALTSTLTSSGAVPTSLSMNGTLSPGNSAVDPVLSNNSPPAPVTTAIDYFTLSATPPTQTVIAGKSTSFTLTLTPHSPITPVEFLANITPACAVPTEAAAVTCTFNPTPVKTIPNSSAATVTLAISTTAPTTAALWKAPTFWYAMWLPISGLAWLGVGSSRRRRWVMGLSLFVVLSIVALLPACGSKRTPGTTGGTQPGTYAIGVSATSGTFTTPASTSPLKVVITVTAPN